MTYSCVCYCTAQEFNMPGVFAWFKERLPREKDLQSYHGVLHVHLGDDARRGHIFVFPYGAIVFWGVDSHDEASYLKALKAFSVNQLEENLHDLVLYQITSKGDTRVSDDEDSLIIAGDDALVFLSLSYALSQSIKLIALENSALATIEATQHLPQELKDKGETSLSRKHLAKEVGALYIERSSINLRSDILDIPEFFWRRPQYESYYLMAYEYMDIGKRLDILNRRLDVIHELYDVLSSELQHIHSSRLEMIIIILIVIEVVIELGREFHLFGV